MQKITPPLIFNLFKDEGGGWYPDWRSVIVGIIRALRTFILIKESMLRRPTERMQILLLTYYYKSSITFKVKFIHMQYIYASQIIVFNDLSEFKLLYSLNKIVVYVIFWIKCFRLFILKKALFNPTVSIDGSRTNAGVSNVGVDKRRSVKMLI